MAIAHIRSGTIIRRFAGEKGWFQLEDGNWASPPVVGYVNGNDKIVPVEDVVDDTSTGSDTIVERSQTVEANRVLVTTTIRDMTAQEIDEQTDNEIQGQFRQDIANLFLDIANRVRALEGNGPITKSQLFSYVKGLR